MSTGRELILLSMGLAAERVGVSREHMRRLAKQGKVEHFIDASGRYLVTEHAITDFIQRRQARSQEER